MKKIFSFIVACLLAMCFISCDILEETPEQKNQRETREAQTATQSAAMTAYPAPQVQNFLERKTVSEWVKRWDKPSVACYVYLISQGNILGYYVSNGKPVSTQSYLIPEEKIEYHSGAVVLQAQDLDGTYGANNPGIRFFTASGIAVEYGGENFAYLYSDAKLPINVPCLGQ